ncbi:MAG: response regulator [Blastocatellia bacterium]|nr:response regulator [Blastocatellia bacterium]
MPKTVLVVEDDFDTQYPLAELLRLKGYSVITASDAEQALSITHLHVPDLIITDIVLPGKSGLHFIASVRSDERIKSTPILVISGCGPMLLVEAESVGADCCLEKPIHIESFWAAIEQMAGITRVGETKDDFEPTGPTIPYERSLAHEIDDLVDKLRLTSSKAEKEDVLRRLKDRIRRLHARNTHFM